MGHVIQPACATDSGGPRMKIPTHSIAMHACSIAASTAPCNAIKIDTGIHIVLRVCKWPGSTLVSPDSIGKGINLFIFGLDVSHKLGNLFRW